MKKFTILASALLFAGAAYAQGPTNQYGGATQRAVTTPTNPNSANPQVNGASQGSYAPSYTSYSQDSYINQAGSGNYATVDQRDGRTPGVGGGSTAILDQTGNNNNASQTQLSVNTVYSNSTLNGSFAGQRDFMRSTQAGSNSQTNQTQNGGVYNTMTVNQGVGTRANRAIQTQNIDASGFGAGNQARINQTTAAGFAAASGNRAEQTQSGILQTAQIDQQGTNSFAQQTQAGGANVLPNNSALIQQGAPGNANTAIQSQTGSVNAARIQQSVGAGNAGNNNFARQTQSLNNNQADIIQRSSGNYAEQVQSGLAGGGGNYSSMDQSNVSSAAYSVQSGNNNSAIVVQH
jgi:hypothetical protein